MVQEHVAHVPVREGLLYHAAVVSVRSPKHSRMKFPNSSQFEKVEVKVEVEEDLPQPFPLAVAQVNLMGMRPY